MRLESKSINGLKQYSEQTIVEGINFLFENINSLGVALTVIPLCLAFIMWNKVDHSILIAWVIVALLVRFSRQWLAYRYFKTKRNAQQSRQWARYFTYSSIIVGSVYGSTAILFFTPDSFPIQLFIFILIIGMSNAVFVSAHWLESYYAFMIPALGLASFQLLSQPDPVYKVLSIITLSNIAMAFSIGKKTQRSVLSSIQLRFENTELLEQLKISQKEAEEANKRKTRFLASASHDLRQPVHALELFSEVLSNETLSPTGKDTLAYLKDCISSLSGLLTSLLDISRLDAGIITPSFGAVNLAVLFKRLSDNLQNQVKNKDLTLRVHCQSCWVYSDSVLLENTLINLLSNAIKYTHQGGILLNCRQRKNEIWIEVWDTGVGIPESEMPRVFDEFYQIDNAERDRRQGLGLGLAIVKREIKILGHEFSLHSRVNRGTVAKIRLQRTSPTHALNNNTSPLQTHDRLANHNILIIDDDESILIATKMIIEQWGCIVQTATNFNEAQVISKLFRPDVIISDFRLREHVTGVEVIEQLRRQLEKTIPAILITGDTAPDRLKQAQESGLILLHKPVKPAKLRVAITRVLNEKH